jgi:purine-binding chemotaxis protein CheW
MMARMAELREAAGSAPGAPDAWLFCLRVLGGRYAFDAALVAEVVRLGPLTRLPAAPRFLPGVFTHRGEVLPVLDVGALLGRPAVPLRGATRAAIVRSGPWTVAIVADAVEGLVAAGALEAAPAEACGPGEFLAGVARDARGEIGVLDVPRLVDAARARSIAA